MKKWIVLAMAAALVLAAAPLAAAGHGHGKKVANGKTKFELVGTIKEISGDGLLVVWVKAGTKTVKNVLSDTDTRLLPVVVADGAKVREIVDGETVGATVGDLDVGAKVKIGGRILEGVFTATKVLAHEAPAAAVEPVVRTPAPDPVVSPEPVEPSPEAPPAT